MKVANAPTSNVGENDTDGLGPLQVEVRWFYRHHNLDYRNQEYEKKNIAWEKEKNRRAEKVGKGDDKENEEGEEIFETGHVAVLEASALLGRLVLKHPQNDNLFISNTDVGYAVPTVVNRCYRYYLHKEQDILQLCHVDNMLSRGLECSGILQKSTKLRKKTYELFGLSPPQNNDDDNGCGTRQHERMIELPSPFFPCPKERSEAYYTSCTIEHPLSQLTHGNLLCPMEKRDTFPKWQLCVGDVVAVHCEEAPPVMGTDVIAGRDKWYPYEVEWSHAQIIAISRKVDSSDVSSMGPTFVPMSSVQCTIRWFYRISDALNDCEGKAKIEEHLKVISEDESRVSEEIFESNLVSAPIDFESLLGPVYIDGKANPEFCKSYKDDETPVSRMLPLNRRICNFNSKGVCQIYDPLEPTKRTHRGIELLTLSTKKGPEKYLEAVLECRKDREQCLKIQPYQLGNDAGNENSSYADRYASEDIADVNSLQRKKLCSDSSSGTKNPPSKKSKLKTSKTGSDNNISSNRKEKQTALLVDDVVNSESRVSCCSEPFHVDASSLKSFYREIEIQPEVDAYDDSIRRKIFAVAGNAGQKGPWKVKLGDMVTLEVDTQDSARISHFPFVVPWCTAEIVSIFRTHKTKESCLKMRKRLQGSIPQIGSDLGGDTGEVMVEIRWFYRKHEIPGALKSASAQSGSFDNKLEELFETDQIDFCSADSILCAIQLHENINPTGILPDIVSGMPYLHYHCGRFWSIHRKAFVPSGPLSNRSERGRMHSAFLGKDGSLKAALKKLEGNVDSKSTSDQQVVTTWKDAFQCAIQKLSLAEAAEDVQVHGMSLKCREKERTQIASFLRMAICGFTRRNEDNTEDETFNSKSSMFIAGPPGTGKTASVRSIITELQEEQASGKIPEFDFIALNGMEMRHPFDAYVKFWEAVSRTRKEKLSPGAAAAELEYYFTSQEVDEEEDVRTPVTVLLLDEIDYIVTKKQTVLYNFFDWPLRSCSKARLIVIGISNTINLPERMTQRVQSRLGGDRCHFQAYNVDDTVTILKTRLGMTGESRYVVFEEDGE